MNDPITQEYLTQKRVANSNEDFLMWLITEP